VLLTLLASKAGLHPGQNFGSMKSVRKIPVLLTSGRVTLVNWHYAVFPIVLNKIVSYSDLQMYSFQTQKVVE